MKTGGRKSRRKISGASQKRVQRSQTGFAKIAMTEESYVIQKINYQYLNQHELVECMN